MHISRLKSIFARSSGAPVDVQQFPKPESVPLPHAPRKLIGEWRQRGDPLFDLGRLMYCPRSRNEAEIRHLCENAFLGGDTILCRALGRYKMFVDTADVGFSTHIMLDGYWEMWVTEAIARLVRPGMVVADIGANLGYFSLLMADLVGSQGRVHAFEPNPQMVRRLQQSIDVNGFGSRTSVHSVALGAVNGERATLVVPSGEPKNGHLQFGDTAAGAEVNIVRLDSRTDWSEIEFMKVDVEGAEELVWAGAEGLLAGNSLKTVVLEFTPGRYANPAGFLNQLLSPGFSLSLISLEGEPIPISETDLLRADPAVDLMLLLQR